jgi:hypothetical protein
MKTISDMFPKKKKIYVVLDNFKTHNPAKFYDYFEQALNKRIPNQEQLKKEVLAWETYRNEHSRTIDWKFTTDDARKKLLKLYPTIVEK